MDPPPALNALGRILKTAQQIEKHEPIVAWRYAMKLGMEIRGQNKDTAVSKFLGELMDILESTKSIVQDVDEGPYLAEFAVKVFEIADNEYQSGAATKNTARSFLHAAVFFEATQAYIPLSDEDSGKLRYAKWKATEIMTAIKEGRSPVPAGATEKSLDEEMNGVTTTSTQTSSTAAPPSTATSQAHINKSTQSAALQVHGVPMDEDIPSTPVFSQPSPNRSIPAGQTQSNIKPMKNSNDSQGRGTPDLVLPDVPAFSSSQIPNNQQQLQGTNKSSTAVIQASPQQQTSQTQSAQTGQTTKAPVSSGFNQFVQQHLRSQVSPSSGNIDVVLEATKYSKNAISALQFDDTETAVRNLRAALKMLTGSDQ